MATLSFQAQDQSLADFEQDRIDSFKLGDIIDVRMDGARGSDEGPPRMGFVHCPEVTQEQVLDRMEEWTWSLSFSQLQRDLVADRWRWEVRNENAAPSGIGGVTGARVDAYLAAWNCTLRAEVAGGRRFDFWVYDTSRDVGGVTSNGFWGRNVTTGVVWAQLAYDQATGIHRISADYTARGWVDTTAANWVRTMGGIVISSGNGVTVFDIHRETVRVAFWKDVRAQFGIWRRRRWYVPAADVSAIMAAGGERAVTQAELVALLRDRRAE